ncbi:MAG: nucleoside-diphosphate kinase [Candidatus Glassbacteria bacterium]
MKKDMTLAVIKPDAVSSGQVGEIIRRLEEAGFTILAMKMVKLSRNRAEEFYAVHRGEHFYDRLVEFMTEGPVVALALSREGAVSHLREVIGDTDPRNAKDGTIRKDLAASKERNVIHASDSAESAALEISFFFSERELMHR